MIRSASPMFFLLAMAAPAWPVDFARDVEPVLARRCYACHGGKQQMNGLRLDDGVAALRGGYSGAVINPGNSAGSKLLQRVTSDRKDFQMPPGGPPLSSAEIAALRDWIDDGARFPARSAADANAKSDHWSFQPVRRPEPPAVKRNGWTRNPIDSFVLARLESEGIAPSPEASRRTLLRRLSLDLTGLPPTPEEIARFIGDSRPGAYERLVDRLLASPHYGEKWARPWLDLARYADSDGYEKDLVRPNAWRYRHWVIDALNRDLPFDEFTIEQLAGDLLSNASLEQRVATGFQRNTLTNREAGVDRAEARFEQLVNRAGTLGTVWLGLTVGCAQCHDHKYDPISQKEFYQIFAFFDRADEEDILAPLPGEWEPYHAARPAYEAARHKMLAGHEIPRMESEWEARLLGAMDHPGVNLEWDFSVTSLRASLDSAERILRTAPGQRTVRQQERIEDYFLAHIGPDFERDAAIKAQMKETLAQIRKLDATLPTISEAQTMVDAPDTPPTHVRLKGDYRALGITVEPGGLTILPPFPAGAPSTRLTLARWLASKDNPLTARVAVNRSWQELFGRGLVHTSEDFGTQGDKPSHPELLDWLAASFMDDGWSMKRLHKRIVMSATYRQASTSRPDLAQRDPDNTLLARQARLRLPAELIRDAALAAGGLLNPAIGGRSIRPPQPEGIAELGYSNSVKWKESTGPDRYRRGLYIHFQRTTPYPQLMTFDAPDSNLSCSRRPVSNTPLQSLNLLNDPVFFEAAQGLARRIAAGSGTFAERLDRAYAICLGRAPATRERERLAVYFDQQIGMLDNEKESVRQLAGGDNVEMAAWVAVGRVLLNLDEFITRE